MPSPTRPPFEHFSEGSSGSGGGGGIGGRSTLALLRGSRKTRAVIKGPRPYVAILPGVALNAASCPIPLVPSAMTRLADAETTAGTGVPVARSVVSGATVFVSKWNRNAAAMDLIGRFGGGAYAVCTGLTLSAPASGLLLHIAAGQSMIDGLVEVPTDTTLAVTDNTARIWIWLLQNGTLTSVNTSTTPPASACCLLGSITTSSGSIRAIDMSGVLYLRGGNAWRQTADAGVPFDTPPSTANFQHRTSGGLYLWDGVAYAGPL